jgi:hypothetical protein
MRSINKGLEPVFTTLPQEVHCKAWLPTEKNTT